VGGSAKPSISSPGSSQIDRLNGAERARHSLLAEPLLGTVAISASERFAHRAPRTCPLAGALAHMLLDEIVDLGADPADHLAARAPPATAAALACSNHGFLPRCDQAMDLIRQRRNPGWVVTVDAPGEVERRLCGSFLVTDRMDGDWRAAHGGMS